MPHFAPVRVRGGLLRSARAARHRRRVAAAGLAVTAVALVAAGGPREADRSRGHPESASSTYAGPAVSTGDRVARARRAGARVTAPVRIADAATVRLLRPGDRVDVIAAEERVTGGEARVVARGARVTEVPKTLEDMGTGGALVVLSVPRAAAADLVGASATARLAVTLW
ncbi:hypothetical protein ACFYQA_30770 [Streptomyces sp. NPDC005774]|uniref:hypothetical protein n=1 Tax=Streptomyces sp. NPDC005774 TaxID=3364728 RepID=UPI0036B4D656